MSIERADVIIVGSGAGGAAAAYRLTRAGLRVLVIEKGPELERSARTLDPRVVVGEGAFKSTEPWRDGRGRRIVPEEYFNLGGKTKWYGAALLRFAPEEFRADPGHACRAWPFDAVTMTRYYDEVERLLGVREYPIEPNLAAIAAHLTRAGAGFSQLPLPMGLAPEILEDANEATHFDGFASARGLKSDAEVALLARVRGAPNLRIVTCHAVVDLLASPSDPRCIEGVRLDDGSEHRASAVLLAAGALHSPRLLERYLAGHGLAGVLPCAGTVGRNLKLHLLTALVAVSTDVVTDRLRKTTAFVSERYPHSSVQPLGFDGELIANVMPRFVWRPLARLIGRRAYGFFLQTEDGSHPDNRVRAGRADDLPEIDYDPQRLPTALAEHRRLIRGLKIALLRAGYVSFAQRIGVTGTAHACGTLVAGEDPGHSVVDRDGRVHGMAGLYVVDGSVLPRSSRVNPSLTIFAWSLRVADALLALRHGGARPRAA